MSDRLLLHTICATTQSAGRDPLLYGATRPTYSAVGDLIRSLIRTARRIRRRVW